MEVLQTQITAMAAAGDAAQEKVLKLVFYLSHFMLRHKLELMFKCSRWHGV